MACVDASDTSFTIKHEIERSIGHKIPMLMMTDSQAFFYTLTRAKFTSEKTYD